MQLINCNDIEINSPSLVLLALRSPTATGSPFGRSLAPWLGPNFEANVPDKIPGQI